MRPEKPSWKHRETFWRGAYRRSVTQPLGGHAQRVVDALGIKVRQCPCRLGDEAALSDVNTSAPSADDQHIVLNDGTALIFVTDRTKSVYVYHEIGHAVVWAFVGKPAGNNWGFDAGWGEGATTATAEWLDVWAENNACNAGLLLMVLDGWDWDKVIKMARDDLSYIDSPTDIRESIESARDMLREILPDLPG